VYNPTASALELVLPRGGDLVGWVAGRLADALAGPRAGRPAKSRPQAGG
jgi:hypothetical protein